MNDQLLSRWACAVASGRTDDPDWPTPDPPCSDEEIVEAEKAMGRKLPEDLIAIQRLSRCWLWREKRFDAVIFQLLEDVAYDHFSPEAEMSRIVVSTSTSERAKPFFYSSLRVTFAYADYFKFQIDEDPTEQGISGQIVVVDFENESIDVIADSLSDFVVRGIRCLEAQAAGGYPRSLD